MDEEIIMLFRLLEPLEMHILHLKPEDLCERIKCKEELEQYFSKVLSMVEQSSTLLTEISKQHQHFNQQMTRFQALFRKSKLSQKMTGENCQLCESPGMFCTKEHLILVLVGTLYETFDEVARSDDGIRGLQISFSVYNFLLYVGYMEPKLPESEYEPTLP